MLYKYRSLDRDLEFGVDYNPRTASLDGSFAQTASGYFLTTDNCETVKIYATTTDEELRVSEFEELSSQGYEGPPKRIENGDAFICMYGSGRSVEWDF